MKPVHSLSTVPAILLLGLVAITPAWAEHDDDEEIPFSEARVFFQLNDTDGDLGFHAILDGEPWKRLSIESPDEVELLRIRTRSELRLQGLTELRFESAEPTFDELDPNEFFARFPEGVYEVEATLLEGGELESEVEISHVLPAAPSNLRVSGVAVPEECDEDPIPVIAGPIVLSWDPVVASHPDLGLPGPIEISRYEVAIEREEPTSLTLTVDLDPDTVELTVPAELIDSGDEIKFQILATDEGGNETSSESCFIVQ